MNGQPRRDRGLRGAVRPYAAQAAATACFSCTSKACGRRPSNKGSPFSKML